MNEFEVLNIEAVLVFRERFVSPYSKIVDPEEAKRQSIAWREEGEIVGVVDSVLDIPHYRHADFLLKCANLGDKLILRINTDEFVSTRKDPNGPIVSLENRLKHAAHYPYTDLVTTKNCGGWDWLNEYRPSFVVKSVTSGTEVLREISEASFYLERSQTKLIIMDEYANVIALNNFYQEGLNYETNKFDSHKISGSIIKREIINRYNLN